MRLKRLLALALVFFAFFNTTDVFCVSVEDETEVAYAVFDTSLKTENITDVFMGTFPNEINETRSGKEVWKIQSSDESSAYLYLDLSPKMGNSLKDGSEYDVEIEYYDQENGYFIVWYDCAYYGAQIAKKVVVTATNDWKTASFTVNDAQFGNGIDGKGDIKISTREKGSKLSSSPCDVYIRSITVTRRKAVNPIFAVSETERPGNTFEWYREDKKVVNKFVNTLKEDVEADVSYQLVDEMGETVFTKNDKISLHGGETKEINVNIDTDLCGLYQWVIKIDNDALNIHSSLSTLNVCIVKTDPDGVTSTFAWSSTHLDRYPRNRQIECIELLKMANIAGTRHGILWGAVESSRNSLSLEGKNTWNTVKLLKEYNVPFLTQLSFGNKFHTGGIDRAIPESEEELEAWRKYCEFTVSALKDYTDLFEVWNEPELDAFNARKASPAALAKVTQIAREVIDEIHPNAKTMGLSLTDLTDPMRYDVWAKGALDAGILDGGMEVMTLHTYAFSEEPEKTKMYDVVKKYQELCASYGVKDIPICITEYGNTTVDKNTSELNKANWITRAAILMNAHGVGDYMFQYNFEKKGIIPSDREDNFGMISTPYEKYNIKGKIGIPTISYLSYAGMNYVLGGDIEAVGIYDKNENVKINKFKSKKLGKNVIATWAAFNNESLTIKLDTESVDCYDDYGNKTVIYGNEGVFSFLLNQRPTYVAGDFEEITVLPDSEFISCDTVRLDRAKEDEAEIILTNNSDKTFEITAYGSGNIKIEAGKKLLPNSSSKIKAVFSDEVGKQGYLTVRASEDDKTAYYAKIPYEIKPRVKLDMNYRLYDSSNTNRWIGEASVTNLSDTNALKGSLRFLAPESFKRLGNISLGYVPKGKSALISFNLPEMYRKGMYTVKYQIKVNGDDSEYIYDDKIDFTIATYAPENAVVDGKKDEWPLNSAMFAGENYMAKMLNVTDRWRGTDDLSATVSVMWNEKDLYIYSTVIDDVFCQNEPPAKLWSGDSMQFALYILPDSADFTALGQAGSAFHEFGVALLPDRSGSATYKYKTQDSKTKTGICETAKSVVIRQGNKTYYEWCMPWADIVGDTDFVPKSGDKLGFSVLWNDNDGSGRRGWLEYASGIGQSKDASLFTYLTLVK